MGYITYHRNQWRVEDINTGETSGPYKRPPIRDKFPNQRQQGEKPLFLPTRLVRVSDMQVINGSELGINERYCAISYSWSLSGDIIKKKGPYGEDEYISVDKGKHVIVDHPSKRVKIKGRPRGRQRAIIPEKKRLVTFKQLIQQICLDFGVQYLWFDQMCINQNDPSEKKREIQQMHRIYQNALFTLALVSELAAKKRLCMVNKHYNNNDNGASNNNNSNKKKYTYTINTNVGIYTSWARRMWCLEELAKSSLLLYIASNGHMWSDVINASDHAASCMPKYHHHYLFSICVKSLKWAACTTLYHAHRRLSTKAHDRIFSLANIYPEETMDKISFTYNQPILELMNQFYRALVKSDIRILLFGINYEVDNVGIEARKEYAAGVPSWVGMINTHLPQLSMKDLLLVKPSQLLPKYIVDDGSSSIYLESSYIPGIILHNKRQPPLKSTLQQESKNKPFSLLFTAAPKPINFDSFQSLSYPGYYGIKVTHNLSRTLVEGWFPKDISLPLDYDNLGYLSLTDSRYTDIKILTELTFTTVFPDLVVMPIVAKEQTTKDHNAGHYYYYKSVGVCFMHKCLLESCTATLDTKQLFVIQ